MRLREDQKGVSEGGEERTGGQRERTHRYLLRETTCELERSVGIVVLVLLVVVDLDGLSVGGWTYKKRFKSERASKSV